MESFSRTAAKYLLDDFIALCSAISRHVEEPCHCQAQRGFPICQVSLSRVGSFRDPSSAGPAAIGTDRRGKPKTATAEVSAQT
jgi:hypothetical protein